MDQTIVGVVLIVTERLHESSGHAYPGIIFVQIDPEFENTDNDDENKQDEAAAASAAAGWLSLAIQGEGGRVLKCIKGVVFRLFGQAVHEIVGKSLPWFV